MSARGFTLIEMVVTIVLIGIVGVALGGIIVPMVRAHQAQLQRAALTDAAESALRRLVRDVRISLPNSLRITNTASGFAIEMIPTVDGGRYCDSNPANCNGDEVLSFNPGGDQDFDIVGCFRNAAFIASASATTSAYRLVIGDASGQIYAASGSPAVVTPSGTAITLTTVDGGVGAATGPCGTPSVGDHSNRHHLRLSAAHRFSSMSPRQRVFVVQEAAAPVTYVCNTTTQTLRRYAGYALQATQPTDPSAAPLNAAASTALVASNLSACSVTTTTADVQARSLLTLSLSVTNAGETVVLMSQLQLDNSR